MDNNTVYIFIKSGYKVRKINEFSRIIARKLVSYCTVERVDTGKRMMVSTAALIPETFYLSPVDL